jgi:hypothetical protein
MEIECGDMRSTMATEVHSTESGIVPIYLEVKYGVSRVDIGQFLRLQDIVRAELSKNPYERKVLSIVVTPRVGGNFVIEILGEDLERDGNVIQRRVLRAENLQRQGVNLSDLYLEPELASV